MGPQDLPRIPYNPRSGQGFYLVREGDLNRARSTLTMPNWAHLSVECVPVDSRLIQSDRGTCHTRWHRLDLDLLSDESSTGLLQTTHLGPATGM
jgi:hypothetical protein